jgi:hypothetical protein
LGAFLRWQEIRPLNRRFIRLGGPSAGSYQLPVEEAIGREDTRVRNIMRIINESPYDERDQGLPAECHPTSVTWCGESHQQHSLPTGIPLHFPGAPAGW